MDAKVIKSKIIKDNDGNIKTITEYNEKGNIIYAKGESEVFKEYDDIGRLIHYSDSTGREYWYEYTTDDNGNTMRTFKDSNGYISTTVYEYHNTTEVN